MKIPRLEIPSKYSPNIHRMFTKSKSTALDNARWLDSQIGKHLAFLVRLLHYGDTVVSTASCRQIAE